MTQQKNAQSCKRTKITVHSFDILYKNLRRCYDIPNKKSIEKSKRFVVVNRMEYCGSLCLKGKIQKFAKEWKRRRRPMRLYRKYNTGGNRIMQQSRSVRGIAAMLAAAMLAGCLTTGLFTVPAYASPPSDPAAAHTQPSVSGNAILYSKPDGYRLPTGVSVDRDTKYRVTVNGEELGLYPAQVGLQADVTKRPRLLLAHSTRRDLSPYRSPPILISTR